ncbi:abortive infection family protein [Mycobacterium marinum]|uniref:abortive infection family protein n=1 Tax=Mycobacterium marinum TaxID=1781 RepID=UPI000E3E2C90
MAYGQRDDIPQLYRYVANLLELKADSVPQSAKGSESAQQILRTLVTTIQSLAELRNELGIGHGQSTRSVALARHARLALNATVTVAEFVLDTWHARVAAGRLELRTERAIAGALRQVRAQRRQCGSDEQEQAKYCEDDRGAFQVLS